MLLNPINEARDYGLVTACSICFAKYCSKASRPVRLVRKFVHLSSTCEARNNGPSSPFRLKICLVPILLECEDYWAKKKKIFFWAFPLALNELGLGGSWCGFGPFLALHFTVRFS